jgi:GNAT superfamily N-acetyltransferase
VLETTIDQQDAPGRRFLLAHGFRIVGQAAHLARPNLDALPSVDLPPGFAITSLGDGPDAGDAYRDLANRLGAYDAGFDLIEPEEMAAVAASPAWEPDGVLALLAPNGDAVGVIRASSADGGYLHEIRLDPAYRGRNLGTALVGAALAYLAAQDAQGAALDAPGPESAPYRLAVRCGFVERHRWQQLLKPLPPAAG